MILLTGEEVSSLRLTRRLDAVRGRYLRAGPWSVTYARPGGLTSAGPNDFFSEGPYWWPDPANPAAPYVRRDGETNPNRFTRNDDDLGKMSEAILSLGLAAYVLGDGVAALHAWEIARVWFLDSKTRMNPNLEFGQAIRGRVAGRGIGLIDTRPLIWCVTGLSLLEWSFNDTELTEEIKDWFRNFVQWMRWSGKGRDEMYNGNNHSTWWVAQVAAYSLYSDIPEAVQTCWDLFCDYLVPEQLRPDGSQPHEESRTRSLSYSLMNLEGLALICRMAHRRGIDLWNYRTVDGAGILASIEYLLPFLERPETWKKPQIRPLGTARGYAVGLAGLDTGRRRWTELQRAWPVPESAWGVILEQLLAR